MAWSDDIIEPHLVVSGLPPGGRLLYMSFANMLGRVFLSQSWLLTYCIWCIWKLLECVFIIKLYKTSLKL